VALRHSARLRGNSNLEHRFGYVNRDRRMLHLGLPPPFRRDSDFGTSMPLKSRGESTASLMMHYQPCPGSVSNPSSGRSDCAPLPKNPSIVHHDVFHAAA
jgi:hypothetical protein